PSEYQRVCKMLYYLWMLNCVTLFLNVLACLAFFIRDSNQGVDFGLSILWFILFTPCSFLCWYRPVYKAFRWVPWGARSAHPAAGTRMVMKMMSAMSRMLKEACLCFCSRTDSSVSFFFFFFVFFCQVAIFVIQAVGIPDWGNSGWVTALSSLRTNKAVGAIMIIVAILFTFCATLSVVLLKMVHGLYRRTGASFQKAQQEFSQGVFTSRTFQTAASSAAQGALQ
ncbi:unnamed protein product, partial [Tetraodon nigroviridis]